MPEVVPKIEVPKFAEKSFFRHREGNLQERVIRSAEDEANARNQGFLPLEELYPDPNAKKGKK